MNTTDLISAKIPLLRLSDYRINWFISSQNLWNSIAYEYPYWDNNKLIWVHEIYTLLSSCIIEVLNDILQCMLYLEDKLA